MVMRTYVFSLPLFVSLTFFGGKCKKGERERMREMKDETRSPPPSLLSESLSSISASFPLPPSISPSFPLSLPPSSFHIHIYK